MQENICLDFKVDLSQNSILLDFAIFLHMSSKKKLHSKNHHSISVRFAHRRDCGMQTDAPVCLYILILFVLHFVLEK